MGYLDAADRLWPVLNRLMKGHTAVYRATGGLVGHRFPGAPPMLLLDHVGAKSGTRRTTPLVYVDDGEDIVIVASKGGHPKHPAWYHNLRAHPETTVQVGSKRRAVRAARGGCRGARAPLAQGGGDLFRLPGLPGAHFAGNPARGARAAI